MKNLILAMLATLALLSLPGCCCGPMLCMPQVGCPNPYWAEDLQDGFCDMAARTNADLCCIKHSISCNLNQLGSRLTCPCQGQPQCQSCPQARPCPQPAPTVQPKVTAKCESPVKAQCGATQTESVACDGPAPRCNERCRRCKQQPCRCGACEGFERTENTSHGPLFSPSQPAAIRPGVSGNPGLQEPASAPPVPPDVPTPPATTPTPKRTTGPTPIVIPKINPGGASSSTSAPIPQPDPSIPLERQTNLNQVGFRKADAPRPIYNGWKSVGELPKALR